MTAPTRPWGPREQRPTLTHAHLLPVADAILGLYVCPIELNLFIYLLDIIGIEDFWFHLFKMEIREKWVLLFD